MNEPQQQTPDTPDAHAQNHEQAQARRRLGRGLNALLGGRDESAAADSAGGEETGELRQVAVGSIEPNPYQPRREFGAETLEELAASIRQHGLLQPVLVRKHGGNFQLIAGERRWLAAKKAGLESVPCRIIERDDRGSTEAAIEENLKRKDLNPLEKAMAFQDYRDRFGCSIEDLAQKLSMQRSTISNFLRLLELPDAVKESLRKDRITGGHARAILTLTDEEARIELCDRIVKQQLSVRATEQEVRRLIKGEATIPMKQPDAPADEKPEPSSHIRSLQQQLQQQLGMKVEIQPTGKEQGRIVIHFQSNHDFARILKNLRKAA